MGGGVGFFKKGRTEVGGDLALHILEFALQTQFGTH